MEGESIPNPFWTYTAWTLYFLTFLETAAFVFYYLGWMTNAVFTISPVALMVITIVQTGIYLLAFAAFVFRFIPVELIQIPGSRNAGGGFGRRDMAKWQAMINYHSIVHCFLAFVGALGGMIMAIVWYAKYNGTTAGHAPSYSDGDIYVWYKQIMQWMTVVWLFTITNLLELFAHMASLQKLSLVTKLTSMISKQLRENLDSVGKRI